MKIGLITDHDQALAAYKAAGHDWPEIPEGCNTVWYHFQTAEGNQAIIINQRGFKRNQADNEEPVNGCSVAVAIDAPDAATARATLEKWVKEFLEAKDD